MDPPSGATVIGRFVELIPHRRVVFTYGWEDGRMGVAPGSTTVEIDLVEHDRHGRVMPHAKGAQRFVR